MNAETREERALRLALEQRCRTLADMIRATLPSGMGFALFLFDFGPGGSMAYVSNADRDDMAKALRELIARLERGRA